MPQHDSTDAETLTHLHASLRATLDYLCTLATLGDLWRLQELLSARAAQVAGGQDGPVPLPLTGIATPMSEIARQRALQEQINRQQSQAMEQIRPWLDQYRQEG